jgi:hypothetical protein
MPMAISRACRRSWAEGEPTVRVDANDEAFAVAPSTAQLVDGGTLDDTVLYKFSAGGSAGRREIDV